MEKYKPEPGYREPYTEYGMEIVMFCAKHCLTKKALAAEAGIPYDSLLATIKAAAAATTSRPLWLPVMARYEAAAKKRRRKGGVRKCRATSAPAPQPADWRRPATRSRRSRAASMRPANSAATAAAATAAKVTRSPSAACR